LQAKCKGDPNLLTQILTSAPFLSKIKAILAYFVQERLKIKGEFLSVSNTFKFTPEFIKPYTTPGSPSSIAVCSALLLVSNYSTIKSCSLKCIRNSFKVE
jgi:hypothetical protein